MRRNILQIVVLSVSVLLLLSVLLATNQYYFEPETIGVHKSGGEFEWRLMMENDVQLCGYRFSILAPVEAATIFDSDTLTEDWAGSGAEIGGFPIRTFQFYGALDMFSGGAEGVSCPPGLEAGSYIAVRISGSPDFHAPYGVYTFAEDATGSTEFTDEAGDTFPVPVTTGYMNIAGLIAIFDLDCPNEPIPEETTVVITMEGYCWHKGTLHVECGAGMPEWADWDTTINLGVEGTLTLTPTFASGPWSGDFIFRYQCSSSLQNVYDTCHIEVLDNLGPFLRADANGDSTIDMSDAVFTLKYLYVPDAPEPPCMDAADSDDGGTVEMFDAIFTLRHLYVPDSPPPPEPGPDSCGLDPTADDLNCVDHPCLTTYGSKKTSRALQ